MSGFHRRVLLAPALGLALLVSCGQSALELDDLTPAERAFVVHFVVLERARAVALAEPVAGTALLDSLAAAWGDSANTVAEAQVPADPARAAAIYDLLGRILAAESDSLVHAPRASRLSAPLPQGAQLVRSAPVPPTDD
jgi:hypothetical protein